MLIHDTGPITPRAALPRQPPPSGARPPVLPKTPFGFVAHCVVGLRGMYLGIFVLETLNAASTMLLPKALGRIVSGISAAKTPDPAAVSALQRPLLWFVVLAVVELVSTRAAGGIPLPYGPPAAIFLRCPPAERRAREAVTPVRPTLLEVRPHTPAWVRPISQQTAGSWHAFADG